jgi:2-polyprenyl-3-methyl-5-hydroxy-6-metoxy-1,4-benzoquinol methylase
VIDFLETPDIDTSSEDYAGRFSGKIGSWFLAVQEEATLQMLAPYKGAKILDVGGGHGQLTGALLRNGYRVTVLGSSDSCKTRIQDLIDGNRCIFKVGNILDLPYQSRTFDVVVSYRLLSHVVQWKRLVSELARVARKSIIVDYPTLRSINYIAPMLFRFKKAIEQNTRQFTTFHEQEVVEAFKVCHFIPADRYPQFCVPMAFHRMLKKYRISLGVEKICKSTGLTYFFGSPIILKLVSDME